MSSPDPETLRRTDMAGIVDKYQLINPGPAEVPGRSRSASQPVMERTVSRALSFGRSSSPSDRADSPSVRSRTNKVGRALRDLVSRSDSTSTASGSRRGQIPRSGRWISSPVDNGVRWLTPSYRAKNDDMHKLFKNLPPGEMVIDDYSCALQRDILAHGRLYLSQQHFCFYSNIFGWETVVVVRLSDVTSLTREKTAHVIPNALQLTVRHSSVERNAHLHRQNSEAAVDDGRQRPVQPQISMPAGDRAEEKYWFTSFVSRDTTYTVLMKAWQNVLLGDPSTALQLRHFACRCWGEKPDVFDAPLDSQQVETSSSEDGNAANNSEAAEGKDMSVLSEETTTACEFTSTVPESLDNAEVPEEAVEAPEESVASGGLTVTVDDDCSVECGCNDHEDTYLDQDFDLGIDKVFELLFTDSDFFKNFCRKHKTIDLCTEEWTKMEGDGQRRQVTYTLSLNKTMGPKFSPTTELQHCLERSRAGKFYKVEVEVTNAGIPYGDVFYTLQQYCLTYVSPRQCHLHVGGCIKYRKSCWGLIKTVIEKNCVEGMASYFTDLAAALEEESLRGSTSSRKRLSRRLSSGSLCDRTPTPSLEKLRDAESTGEISDRTTPTLPHLSSAVVRRKKGGLSRNTSTSSEVNTTPTPSEITMMRRAASQGILQQVLLVLLLILVVFNVLFLARLYKVLPPASISSSTPAQDDGGFTHWQELLQLQRRRHQVEINRWQRSVHSTSKTLIHVMGLLEGFLEEQAAAGTLGANGGVLFKTIQEKLSRATTSEMPTGHGGGDDGGR